MPLFHGCVDASLDGGSEGLQGLFGRADRISAHQTDVDERKDPDDAADDDDEGQNDLKFETVANKRQHVFLYHFPPTVSSGILKVGWASLTGEP